MLHTTRVGNQFLSSCSGHWALRVSALVLAGCYLFCATDGAWSAEPAGKPTTEDWAAFRQNSAQTGVTSAALPERLEVLWSVSLGEQVVASSAIVGDAVYVPCLSGELHCLELKTGASRWKYRSTEKVEPNIFPPGFKAPPTVTAEAVYLGDEDGTMHAVDRKTGKKLWTYSTRGEIYSAAMIHEGKLLFGSYDNSLHCLNAADGQFVWKVETQGYVHCTPAITEGHAIIAGCDEHLRSVEIATGKVAHDLHLKTYLIASPAVLEGMLYVGTYSNEVVAVDWKNDEVRWRYQPENANFPFHSSAAVTDRYVVLGGRDKSVHAIHRETGKVAWTFPTRARVDSSPAVVGNRVFIGSSDGNLYELDLKTGREVWKSQIGGPVTAGPVIGQGVLVVGGESRDGKVVCFGKK